MLVCVCVWIQCKCEKAHVIGDRCVHGVGLIARSSVEKSLFWIVGGSEMALNRCVGLYIS